ncbi:hypothetical protein [Bacillus cereus]|uniref:hypothetical protein n=1 Tax=Bacillus cereus TaxID=1396 RepID=UPI0015D4CF9C|nr:hypothetical protein [Bacillus cereus]
MLMKWEFERALVMWKEWMSKKKTYTDDLAAEGTMYVVNGSVAKFLTLLEK